MITLIGRLLAPDDRGRCAVTVEDRHVTSIRPAEGVPDPAEGGADAWIIPGLVDLQLNGAFGVDFADASADVASAAAALPATGVTAFLPTIVSSPAATYAPALANLARPMPDGAARVLGVHLEGPFIAASRRGTHDPVLVRAPDLDELRAWLASGAVQLVTLAPELAGADSLIRELVARGVVVAIGHSNAAWAEADAAIQAGARLGTHLFNAMRPFHHRDPGIVGRLLAPGVAVSVVADGVHVAPETVRLVAATKGPDHLILVTDGVAALGERPGTYRLGTQEVESDGVVARLSDGTISGSVAPFAPALGRLVAAGLDASTAVRAASTNPARLLGLDAELGRIEVGRVADLVLLDATWNPLVTLVEGRRVRGDTAMGRRSPPEHPAPA